MRSADVSTSSRGTGSDANRAENPEYQSVVVELVGRGREEEGERDDEESKNGVRVPEEKTARCSKRAT